MHGIGAKMKPDGFAEREAILRLASQRLAAQGLFGPELKYAQCVYVQDIVVLHGSSMCIQDIVILQAPYIPHASIGLHTRKY